MKWDPCLQQDSPQTYHWMVVSFSILPLEQCCMYSFSTVTTHDK